MIEYIGTIIAASAFTPSALPRLKNNTFPKELSEKLLSSPPNATGSSSSSPSSSPSEPNNGGADDFGYGAPEGSQLSFKA